MRNVNSPLFIFSHKNIKTRHQTTTTIIHLLEQEGVSLPQSIFNFSSFPGKVFPLLRHVFPCFSQFCHDCLELLHAKWETLKQHFASINHNNKQVYWRQVFDSPPVEHVAPMQFLRMLLTHSADFWRHSKREKFEFNLIPVTFFVDSILQMKFMFTVISSVLWESDKLKSSKISEWNKIWIPWLLFFAPHVVVQLHQTFRLRLTHLVLFINQPQSHVYQKTL